MLSCLHYVRLKQSVSKRCFLHSNHHHCPLSLQEVKDRTEELERKRRKDLDKQVRGCGWFIAKAFFSKQVKIYGMLIPQAEELSKLAADALAAERKDRLAELDGIRERINTLSVALDEQKVQQKANSYLHSISAATYAIEEAVTNGQPFSIPLHALKARSEAVSLGMSSLIIIFLKIKMKIKTFLWHRSAQTGTR